MEYGTGEEVNYKKGINLLLRIKEGGSLDEEINKNAEFDEVIKFTAMGEEAGDGIILCEARFRLDERWADREEDRTEQLKGCAKVKLKMYHIKGKANTTKGDNIDLDFNKGDGDMWIRDQEDRAGGE
jgi:hypothetical protein